MIKFSNICTHLLEITNGLKKNVQTDEGDEKKKQKLKEKEIHKQ